MRDPYAMLGVDRNADQRTIKAAFLRRLKEHHPDLNPGDATAAERFREITGAYELLRNPRRRNASDRHITLIGRAAGRRTSSGRSPKQNIRTGLMISFAAGALAVGALWLFQSTPVTNGPSSPDRLTDQNLARLTFKTTMPVASQAPGHNSAAETNDRTLDRPAQQSTALASASHPSSADGSDTATFNSVAPDAAAPSGPLLSPEQNQAAPSSLEINGQSAAETVQPSTPPQVAAGSPSASGRPPTPPATLQAIAPVPPKSAHPRRLNPNWTSHLFGSTGLMLKIPAGVFTVQSPAGETTGRLYATADGRAVLRIVSSDNPYGLSAHAIRRHVAATRYAGADFDSRAHHPNVVVLSGRLGSEQFYDVTVISCDRQSVHGWHLAYQSGDDGLFAPLIENMTRAFLDERPQAFRCRNIATKSLQSRKFPPNASVKPSIGRNVATSSGHVSGEQ